MGQFARLAAHLNRLRKPVKFGFYALLILRRDSRQALGFHALDYRQASLIVTLTMSECRKVTTSNIDILGDTWFLAPGGHQLLDQSKTALWDLRYEILGLSTLLRGLGPDPGLDPDALYGLGILLARISRRIGKVQDRLERAETAKPGIPVSSSRSLSR